MGPLRISPRASGLLRAAVRVEGMPGKANRRSDQGTGRAHPACEASFRWLRRRLASGPSHPPLCRGLAYARLLRGQPLPARDLPSRVHLARLIRRPGCYVLLSLWRSSLLRRRARIARPLLRLPRRMSSRHTAMSLFYWTNQPLAKMYWRPDFEVLSAHRVYPRQVSQGRFRGRKIKGISFSFPGRSGESTAGIVKTPKGKHAAENLARAFLGSG